MNPLLLNPYVDTSATAVRASPKPLPLRQSQAARAFARMLGAPSVPTAACRRVIGARFGVTWDELQGTDRHQRISFARHVAAWLLRVAGLSYPEIGAELRRDHTTAMASCARVEALREADASVREATDAMVVEMSAAGCPAFRDVGVETEDEGAEA